MADLGDHSLLEKKTNLDGNQHAPGDEGKDAPGINATINVPSTEHVQPSSNSNCGSIAPPLSENGGEGDPVAVAESPQDICVEGSSVSATDEKKRSALVAFGADVHSLTHDIIPKRQATVYRNKPTADYMKAVLTTLEGQIPPDALNLVEYAMSSHSHKLDKTSPRDAEEAMDFFQKGIDILEVGYNWLASQSEISYYVRCTLAQIHSRMMPFQKGTVSMIRNAKFPNTDKKDDVKPVVVTASRAERCKLAGEVKKIFDDLLVTDGNPSTKVGVSWLLTKENIKYVTPDIAENLKGVISKLLSELRTEFPDQVDGGLVFEVWRDIEAHKPKIDSMNRSSGSHLDLTETMDIVLKECLFQEIAKRIRNRLRRHPSVVPADDCE